MTLIIQGGVAQISLHRGPLIQSIQDGKRLPHPSVRAVAKPVDGVLWIGTEDGLCQYNGFIWTDVAIGAAGVPHPHINDLELDSSGSIWIATEYGVAKYSEESRGFYHPEVLRTENGTLLRAQALQPLSGNRVLVAFESLSPSKGGLAIWDQSEETWSSAAYSEYSLFDLIAGPPGTNVYYACGDGIVLQIDHQGQVMKEWTSFSEERIVFTRAFSADDGRVYFCAESKGLWVLDSDNANVSRIWSQPTYGGCSLNKGELLLSSSDGWVTLHTASLEVVPLLNQPNEQSVPSLDEINCTYKDEMNVLWIGTDAGLMFVDPMESFIQCVAIAKDGVPLEADAVVGPAFDGSYIFGTKKGVFQVDGSFRKVIHVWEDLNLEDGTMVRLFSNDLCLSEDGYLVYISRGKQLIELDLLKGNGRLLSYVDGDNEDFFTFLVLHKKQLYARCGRTLVRVSLADGSVSRLVQTDEKGHAQKVLNIASGDEFLWAVFSESWGFIDDEMNFTDLASESLHEGELPFAGTAIAVHGDSLIFLGSQLSGVQTYTWKEGRLTELSNSNPDIPRLWVRRFQADANHGLWATTKQGLFRYDFYQGDIRGFDARNGLFRNDLETSDLKLTHDSLLFLSVGSAWNLFDLNNYTITDPGCQVLISGVFSLGDQLITEVSKDDRLIEMDHDQSSFYFAIANSCPHRVDKLQFRYRLIGASDAWQTSVNGRTASFVNVEGGEYTLEVQLKEEWGDWGETKRLDIAVNLPWYDTMWFRLLVLFALIGIVWAVLSTRSRRLARESELRNAFELQLSELKMAALRSQMNPHFLFNSLNSIKNYILSSRTEEAADYISDFSRLIRLMLNNSRKDFIQLSEELSLIRLYISIEQRRFDKRFEFHCDIDQEILRLDPVIPSMLIQPHLENAIWHGLMHSVTDRVLKLSMHRIQERAVIIVEDNGIGRRASEEFRKNSLTKRESLGTSITQERIHLISSIHGSDIQQEVIDLENEGASGTRVIITMNLK